MAVNFSDTLAGLTLEAAALTLHQGYQQARLARDPRFDGLFFVAVTSTGIYCRSICPAPLAKEHNVRYFESAIHAAQHGFRPCLRCRPDSAPGSPAWLGTDTTLKRAVRLIEEGALVEGNQQQLCQRLGISARYLRKLFQRLGISAKQYALYQQVLFAKQLLHQTSLPIQAIAFQAGFHSVRRFQDEFKQQLALTPSQIRGHHSVSTSPLLQLELAYRPPLAWPLLCQFWHARSLLGVEWQHHNSYGRTFDWQGRYGWFEVEPDAKKPLLHLTLYWPFADGLAPVVAQIRRLLDLDADMATIDDTLSPHFQSRYIKGLRIPGVWGQWEAAVRAILGQQVSVAGARTQLNRLCEALGDELIGTSSPLGLPLRLFPTPEAVLASDLQMIKVPEARRTTLKALASTILAAPDADPQTWLAIKGIGPWTVAYAKMRGMADTDMWLAGDLGLQKALQQHAAPITPTLFSPWQSYATFQLWFNLPAKTPRALSAAPTPGDTDGTAT